MNGAPGEAVSSGGARKFTTAAKDVMTRIVHGILRFAWDPVWNVQVVLFFIGGMIEWLLITELLKDAVKISGFGVEHLALFSSLCVAVAVTHQFLILRNIEVVRSNSQSSTRKGLLLGSTMVSVFLLATITGEVPYLLSLLLFKEGPSDLFVRTADVLDVFSNYQSWTNVTKKDLQHGFPLYCKGLFFTASLFLAVWILLWDGIEKFFGRLREPYGPFTKLRVWQVFAISDLFSVMIWVGFLRILVATSKFPPELDPHTQLFETERKQVISTAIWIVFWTAWYASIILLRIARNVFSKHSAHELHNRIV